MNVAVKDQDGEAQPRPIEMQSRGTQLGHSVAWTDCGGRGSRAIMYTHEYQMAPFLVRYGKTTKLLHLTVRCVARGRGALSEHST